MQIRKTWVPESIMPKHYFTMSRKSITSCCLLSLSIQCNMIFEVKESILFLSTANRHPRSQVMKFTMRREEFNDPLQILCEFADR